MIGDLLLHTWLAEPSFSGAENSCSGASSGSGARSVKKYSIPQTNSVHAVPIAGVCLVCSFFYLPCGAGSNAWFASALQQMESDAVFLWWDPNFIRHH